MRGDLILGGITQRDEQCASKAGPAADRAVRAEAYRLLHNIKRIPGTEDDGKVDVTKLKTWITEVRGQCKSYGREDVGDNAIGELLSKSGPGEDGIPPIATEFLQRSELTLSATTRLMHRSKQPRYSITSSARLTVIVCCPYSTACN